MSCLPVLPSEALPSPGSRARAVVGQQRDICVRHTHLVTLRTRRKASLILFGLEGFRVPLFCRTIQNFAPLGALQKLQVRCALAGNALHPPSSSPIPLPFSSHFLPNRLEKKSLFLSAGLLPLVSWVHTILAFPAHLRRSNCASSTSQASRFSAALTVTMVQQKLNRLRLSCC